MRTGFYRKLESPMGLANIQLTDYFGDGMMITRIYVPEGHRGKGIARELLAECLKDADHHNEDFPLTPAMRAAHTSHAKSGIDCAPQHGLEYTDHQGDHPPAYPGKGRG